MIINRSKKSKGRPILQLENTVILYRKGPPGLNGTNGLDGSNGSNGSGKVISIIDKTDIHLTQKVVHNYTHIHKAVNIDRHESYCLDSSRLAAIERRLTALGG